MIGWIARFMGVRESAEEDGTNDVPKSEAKPFDEMHT